MNMPSLMASKDLFHIFCSFLIKASCSFSFLISITAMRTSLDFCSKESSIEMLVILTGISSPEDLSEMMMDNRSSGY